MLRAVAFVDTGLWVAKCPRPHCNGAEHFGPHPLTGYVGGLTARGFTCANCHWQGPVGWPPNVDDINFLLSLRPVPDTRNWLPHETVHDLLAENATHGVHPPLDADPAHLRAGVPLLGIAGDHIAVGRELMAATRRSILGGP